MESQNLLIADVKSEEDRKMAFEQYKMIFESINQLSIVRETSNQFWVIVNTAAISSISYLKEVESLKGSHRTFMLLTLLFLGWLACGCWLQYLLTIKNNIDSRFEMLKELEIYFPVKAFIRLSEKAQLKIGKGNLTLKQILVPCIFLVGYTFLAFFLFFVPPEVILW